MFALMKTVIVIRLGRLGDVALTGPTIKNLRFLYPDARLILVTRQTYQPMAALLPGLDDSVPFPDDGGYLDLLRLSRQLDDLNPELVVDLHKNFRSFHLGALSKAPYRVVYHKRRKERQDAVNEKKFIDPVPHTVDLYNHVLTELKGEILARAPDIVLPPESLWRPSASRRDGVALAPGASSPVKAWPVDRYAALAERIAADFKIPVRIILGERDASLAETFAPLPSTNVSVCLKRSLAEVAAVMARSRLVLPNDSGLMHLSSATGAPTAALFGPTHEQLGFYPLGLHDTVISVDETCRPCSLHGNKPCYREQQYCFTRLTVDEVYRQAAALLERITLRPAAFIDRDGTLIEDKHYLADPDKIVFVPGALEAVRKLKQAGCLIVVVSNQSGVARGFFPTTTVDRVHQRLTELMAAAGCAPDDIRFCPHLPDGDDPAYRGDCECRKPKPGMLEQAGRELHIDMKRSYMIGDKFSDIQCGRAAGTAAILVRTGEGRQTENNLPSHPYLRPDAVADGVGAAAEFIVSRV